MWVLALLALDSLNYAVLSGQKGIPFVGSLAADAKSQQTLAERSAVLNSDRGIAHYALAQLARISAGVEHDHSEIDDLYRRSVQVDPWNPTLKHEYASFLYDNDELNRAHSMVMSAVQLRPMDVAANLTAVKLKVELGDSAAALQLALAAMQWCELMARQSPAELNRLGATLTATFRSNNAPELRKRLNDCRSHLENTRASQRPSVWLMRLFKP